MAVMLAHRGGVGARDPSSALSSAIALGASHGVGDVGMAISVMPCCQGRTYTLPMAMKEALLAEFDHEMGKTRRLMERLPEADKAR